MAVSFEDYQNRNCVNVNPDIFFPNANISTVYKAQVEMAKRICADCVIRDGCFDQAQMNHEKQGVWGGVDFAKRYPRIR